MGRPSPRGDSSRRREGFDGNGLNGVAAGQGAAVKRMQAAIHDHETARKELMALTSKALALITRATPIEAFGRQFRRRPVRRPPRTAPKPNAPGPSESAANAPVLSNGAAGGARTRVSAEAASSPTPLGVIADGVSQETPAPRQGAGATSGRDRDVAEPGRPLTIVTGGEGGAAPGA